MRVVVRHRPTRVMLVEVVAVAVAVLAGLRATGVVIGKAVRVPVVVVVGICPMAVTESTLTVVVVAMRMRDAVAM